MELEVNQPQNTRFTPSRKVWGAVTAMLAMLLAGASVTLQADDWEWDPTWGYHEEEWYDPSDWFNSDPGIDYENDYYGSYYDYGYDPYSTSAYDTYGYDDNEYYDYGYDDYWHNGYDYYSSDWYDEVPEFDTWYD